MWGFLLFELYLHYALSLNFCIQDLPPALTEAVIILGNFSKSL